MYKRQDFDYKAFLLRPKPSIEDLEYKALDKKRANADFAANRDYTDYEKFGSILFCNASFNSRIESANYAKQMELKNWDKASKESIAVAVCNGAVYEPKLKK